MDVVITKYGHHEVTLSNGAVLRLKEARAGRLEVLAIEGALAVHPRSANVVEIAAVDFDGMEVWS